MVEVDLPGVEKDDISVELSGNELVVTGGLKDGADGQSRRWIRRSGHAGQRLLPTLADADKLTASLSGGMLTVTAPKSETSKPHRGRGHFGLSRTSGPATAPKTCPGHGTAPAWHWLRHP